MKPAALRPIVVLALVAAVYAHGPAPAEAKGKPANSTRSSGINFTNDGRTEVFSETETDLITGEVSAFEAIREFDNRGLLIREQFRETLDGQIIRSEETAFTYGQALRLSKVMTVTDPDGEGPVPAAVRVDTLTRNSKHKLISIESTIDEDGDGVIDSTETETRDFDARGRVVSTQTESGGFVVTVALTYDSHGNVLASTTDTDDLSTAQSPDSRDTSTSTYDGRNFVSQQHDQSFVFDASGDAQLVLETTVTFSRSDGGRIEGAVETIDSDGDGDVDITAESTETYDNRDNPLTNYFIVYDGPDVFEGSAVYTNDAKGRPVQVVSEEFLNGALTFRAVEINTFDKFGRTIESVDSRDFDGDGNTDTIETFTAEYDNHDRQIFITESVTDATGTLLFSSTRTRVYGKDTSTTTQEIDSDGDGTIDRRVVTVSPL